MLMFEYFDHLNFDYRYRRLTRAEHEEYLYLLELFLNEAKGKWFMEGGSLLGCVRCAGMLPYDDDMDISMEKNQLNYLKSNYKSDEIGFEDVYNDTWGSYTKVYLKRNPMMPNCKFSWPFIDLFPYEETENELLYYYVKLNKHQIYPLRLFPFDKFYVQIPNNPDEYLEKLYPNYKTVCITSSYNHKINKSIRTKQSSCAKLLSSGPIVVYENGQYYYQLKNTVKLKISYASTIHGHINSCTNCYK